MPLEKTLYEVLFVTDPNKPEVTPEAPPLKLSAKALSRGILNSPQYRESLKRRIMMDELPPAVECKLWEYAYGKPVERVEVEDKTVRLDELSADQMVERALFLADLAKRIKRGETERKGESEPSSDSGSVH